MDSLQKTRRSLLPWLLSVALLGAQGLAAQDKVSRVRASYDASTFASIEALVAEARVAGIPVGPLYDKALEGAAKRVPAARVLPALGEFSSRMQTARGLMDGAPTPAAIVAGADALRRGVSHQAITDVSRAGGHRTAVALLVAGDLVESGVTGERALNMIREALAHTRDDDGLLDVPATLRRLVREGAVPRDAAEEMLKAMRDGTPLRRVRHRPGGGRPGADVFRTRPVPPGSDPTSSRRRGGNRSGG
jgi:hypothetical protein